MRHLLAYAMTCFAIFASGINPGDAILPSPDDSAKCITQDDFYYNTSTGFWELPFRNSCNRSVQVTAKYDGSPRGVCVPPNTRCAITLYYDGTGKNTPKAKVSWTSKYGTCTECFP